MASLATIATIASTAVAVGQTITQSHLQKIQNQRRAEQLEVQKLQTEKKAKQEMAIATHAAAQERKKAEFVKSRATALAAGSGASGYDPFELEAEGDYRVLTALYNGEIASDATRMRARQLQLEGAANETRGIYDRYNTYARGASTLADNAETLYDRFG
jgi:hypothetical protein